MLEQCAQEADSELRGLGALSGPCPDIAGAIHDLALDAELPAGWRDHVSAGALSNWGALADRYSRTGPAGEGSRLADPGRLRAIAHSLPLPLIRPTLSQQVWAWLRAWLGQHRDFLERLGAYLPAWRGAAPLQGVLYGLLVLIVAGAVLVIYRELRAAGVIGARVGRRRPQAAPHLPENQPSIAPGAVPPRLQPVLLLRALVEALTRAQRLEQERILTCRELVAAARFDTDAQRERFAALTVLAERVLYGEPRTERLPHEEAVLAAAQSLEEQLRVPASPAAEGAS